MKEILQQILRHIHQEDLILVTIISRQGSAPRGVGSQMLAGQAGLLTGTVGGGAVEACALRHAGELLVSGRSCRVSLDLTGTTCHSLDMVCGGGVELLFSYIPKGDAHWQSLAERALEALETRRPGTLLLSHRQPPELIWGDPSAPYGGCLSGDVFHLPLPLPQRVVVFGGGHVAQALVPLLAAVDFQVVVFDNRREFADPARFPQAKQVICGVYENIPLTLSLDPQDFYIIMTHGHSFDFALENQLLRRPFAYLGVMGSRRKTASVNARLKDAGVAEEAIAQVHTPIGVAIGAVTPAEIALSIAAQCIACRAARRNPPSP